MINPEELPRELKLIAEKVTAGHRITDEDALYYLKKQVLLLPAALQI